MATPRWLPAAAAAGATVGAWATAVAINRSLRDVEGESMLPTLAPGDRIVVVPAAVLPVRRGDVVVARDPRDPTRATVKRVVGLPGEAVEVRAGRLSIDGVAQLEGYATARIGESVALLGEDEYFLLGDNRGASTDSRAFGPVTSDLLDAVAVATVAPQVRLGLRVEPWPMATAS